MGLNIGQVRMAFRLGSTAQDLKEVQKSPAGLNVQLHFLCPSLVSIWGVLLVAMEAPEAKGLLEDGGDSSL